uniref:C2 domain-containing protein n=1 Tax=Panagrellus redivivus TaxID=6233 RepID=A0A7E4UUC7_PANRE
MLSALTACYSAACWPINCIFCSCNRRPPANSIDDSPRDLSPDDESTPTDADGFVRWSDKANKNFGTLDDDVCANTLPNGVPQIRVDDNHDGTTKPFSINENAGEIVGTVQVTMQYSSQKKLVILTVVETIDKGITENGNTAFIQVRIALLEAPSGKKSKTKMLPGPQVTFGQTFTFTVEPEDLANAIIRFRLYRSKCTTPVKRSTCRGECVFPVAAISVVSATHLLYFRGPATGAPEKKKSVTIDPAIPQSPSSPPEQPSSSPQSPPDPEDPTMLRQNSTATAPSGFPSRRGSTVDSSGRFCSLPTENGAPEALVSLCYLDQAQKIVVSVQKASNLDTDKGSPSDTYLRISLLSQFGEELAKQRSSTVKACSEPVYECTAVFQITQDELENSSVLIQIFRNSGMLRKRQQIGFVCMGLNASSPDAQTHWEQMIQGLGTSVEKWHHLKFDTTP